MKKRILSMLLAIVMVVSMIGGFAFAAGVEDFSDVEEGKWYYDYVDRVAELGYFIGLPDGTFSPETPVNRAAMVLVLARMAQRFGVDTNVDLDAKGVETPFVDVPENEWYAAAVKWAYDNGITTGVSTTEFMPREPVTREDSCTFILRFLEYMAGKLGNTYEDNKTHKVFEFVDEADIRDYAAEAIDECMAYGIVEGTTGDETGYFYPRETWKRGEGAKMISILHDILMRPDTTVIPDPPVPTTYTASLQYVVDGEVVKTETQQSYSNNFTWTVLETVDILGTDTYTNDAGTEYAIIGWSKGEAAAVVDNVAGDTFGSAAGTVKRYAVLVPVNDYIKLAILGLIDDVNGYAGKIEDTTVSDGYYDLHVGKHLDFADAYLDTGDNTVYVAATGTLNSETVTELLELATGYAVSLLSYEKQLPTEEEIMDIVTDVAGSVGIDIDGKTAEEIAEDVYADIEEIGNVLFDNFKNYNGGLCIEAVTLMNGDEAVATLDIGTQDKLDEAAAKDLAIVIAKQVWEGMKTQTGSEIDLHFAITLVFDPAYNSGDYNNAYVLDVTLTLASDMYHYDGTTNTLTFIIKKDLQAQYAESVEAIVSAAWGNIDNLYKDATGEDTGVTDMLKAELVEALIDLEMDEYDAKVAADAWIAANMMVENPDETIASLYEFLWTMEGKPVDGVTVGDNGALYAAVQKLCEDMAEDIVAEALEEAKNQADSWDDLHDFSKYDAVTQAIEDIVKTTDGLTEEQKIYLIKLCNIAAYDQLGQPEGFYADDEFDADSSWIAPTVNEMILETLLTFEYEGTNLVETVAKAAELKTIKRLSDDATLKVFSDLLKNSAVQDLAVEHIGDKVTYLVDYIDAIPAGVSVSVDGVVYSAAELQDLKAIAATGDAKAVCDELADLLGLIGYISMADMADGNTIEIVVNDGSYEYAMNFALEIE